MKPLRWTWIVLGLALSLSVRNPLVNWVDWLEREAYQVQIEQSLRVCFALEGFYPPNFAYLVEHYGVQVHPRYLVRYKAFASNLKPEVSLHRRGALR
jgi:hypothetical protein